MIVDIEMGVFKLSVDIGHTRMLAIPFVIDPQYLGRDTKLSITSVARVVGALI